jgi:Domain of unknown function (DUF4760)
MSCEPSQSICFLGDTIGFWIQTLVFFFSALAAAWAVRYNAQQVKQLKEQLRVMGEQSERNDRLLRLKSTIDAVSNDRHNEVQRQARIKFSELRSNGTSFTSYICNNHKEENDAILAVLSNYEYMAIGINEGAFDEAIYKRMVRGLFIRDWENLTAYVHELRTKHKNVKLFKDFESLACKWQAEQPS